MTRVKIDLAEEVLYTVDFIPVWQSGYPGDCVSEVSDETFRRWSYIQAEHDSMQREICHLLNHIRRQAVAGMKNRK